MTIPEATHLQSLILGELLGGPRPGRELRSALAEQGAEKSLAAFYQLMARIEGAGWVVGWYELVELNNTARRSTFKERWYQLTEAGRGEWTGVRDFYSAVIKRPGLKVVGKAGPR